MPSGNQTLHWEIPSSFVEKIMIFLLITQGFFASTNAGNAPFVMHDDE
jgi:hypothetical protein